MYLSIYKDGKIKHMLKCSPAQFSYMVAATAESEDPDDIIGTEDGKSTDIFSKKNGHDYRFHFEEEEQYIAR